MKIKLKWNIGGSFTRIMEVPDGKPPKEVTLSWREDSILFAFVMMEDGVPVYHLKKKPVKT